MEIRRPLRPARFVCACALLAVALVAARGGTTSRHAHRTSLAAGLPAIPVVATGGTRSNGSVVAPPTCVNNAGASFTCYSPALIQAAYDFPTGAGAPTGAGETIVVVDAFGSSTIRDDLAAFDARWGVPAPPSFDVVGPNGSGDPSDPNVVSWQQETSLDVEWAHALAPGARIVLVVSANDADDVMNAAEAAALPRYPGAIVSHSFGSPETDDVQGNVALHFILLGGLRLGDTLVAGAGDAGATNGTDSAIPSYPASDPIVTGVGGTEGRPYPDGLLRRNGRYGDEKVWNEGDTADLATGGAPSVFFPVPPWQAPLSKTKMRGTPDVAFDAALNGGVVVAWHGGTLLMGGTSVGTPAWAAIFALANDLRGRAGGIGFANPALYALAGVGRTYKSDFHDITAGNNALDSSIGFRANDGYDLATGLGTPDVANLLPDLAAARSGSGADPGEPSGHDRDGGRHGREPGR
jgi:subtilase family serine protease